MSTQWRLMYHKPREQNHDDDEPPALHWERGSFLLDYLLSSLISVNVMI